MANMELKEALEYLEKGQYASLEEARRARAENMKVIEDIVKAEYESMDEAGRARLDEARRRSEELVAEYRDVEEAEGAFIHYKVSLSKLEYNALVRNMPKYEALLDLFLGASGSPENLKQYAGMTVSELAELGAENYRNGVKQQIDLLQTLLQKVEKEDQKTAAALNWGIFQLEQQTKDRVSRITSTPEAEMNSIMGSEMFRETVRGCLVMAMQATGAERGGIQKAVDALDTIFGSTDAEAAWKAYQDL